MEENDEKYKGIIKSGGKLQAVKMYMADHNCGMKEAKRAIEEISGEKNNVSTSKGGCLSIIIVLIFLLASLTTFAGERYNFNAQWLLSVGDNDKGQTIDLVDKSWQKVTLPYAYNQTEAYSRNCADLSDTVMWYRKHFVLPQSVKDAVANGQRPRIMIEFEGARFGAQVYLNGKYVGIGENGVMAFGFDLTPYINYSGDNVLAVRVDNDWKYHEVEHTFINEKGQKSSSGFQWNDKNFYCNYGGINKNVWLHIMPEVYQTLPLYTNMKTTGVYVFGKVIDTKTGCVEVNVESQVINSTKDKQKAHLEITLLDKDGSQVATFKSGEKEINAGDTTVLSTYKAVNGLHLWSWGYGYLYTVKSCLVVNGSAVDTQDIQTGFRKTAFHDGMFYLNDRVLQLKGFAQRSTNEWPVVGISVPSWLSDYSNKLVLGCNGNFFRWMHVTPSKQDIRSFDRLGLIQAMPAGDAEKDVSGRRWEQRLEVERDAIIYNRNNPSVIFYEGGNNQISEEHMMQLKAIRDKYDPNGGRASGSRNMLDSKIAEYGGEMLYVNCSAGKPMWQMEYNRDEGIRRYWDQWSYPYHIEGDGPLYRGSRAVAYNHNQDGLAIENITRWNEYWMCRPGMGKRVNSGGAKIIFSDSNTHARGEKSYRTSGDVDPMRITKDSYYTHKVMWNGWVDNEQEGTYIIGHWNYENGDKDGKAVTKPVYVCSTGDEVELFLNGKNLGKGKRSETFLFTWDNVKWEAGTLKAVAYKNGKEVSSDTKKTVGKAVALRMHWISPSPTVENRGGAFRADGADLRIAEIEAVDKDGNRNPLAHDMIHFTVSGKGTYLGGCSGVVSDADKETNAKAQAEGHEGIIAEGGHSKDTNGILSQDLMLECGVIRVFVRSTTEPGKIILTAKPTTVDGKNLADKKKSTLKGASLSITTVATPVKDGFYVSAPRGGQEGAPIEADWAKADPLYLDRGETPQIPSYTQKLNTVAVKNFETASNKDDIYNMVDDNEASKWSSDGKAENAYLKVTLTRPAKVKRLDLRLNNFRSTSYPLQIFANGKKVWEGYTPKSLGNCYLDLNTTEATDTYEIRMIGEATVKEAFGSMTELAAKKNVSTKAGKSRVLSIIEMSFNE